VVWIDVCTPLRHNIFDVRKVSSVDQAVIDLVEGVSIWGVPGGRWIRLCMKNLLLITICLPAASRQAGCTCPSLADVRFPGQHLCSRLPSLTSLYCLGRLRMPAPADHKIDPWPPLLSQLKNMPSILIT
jgi:hypothetical protein